MAKPSNMNRRTFLGTATTATVAGVVATIWAPARKAWAGSKLKLAFVPKALNNPVFEVTRWGAEDRVKELGGDIDFRWVGPTTTDAAAQAQIIDDLVIQGVDGNCLSCNDPDALIPAIDRAVQEGVTVITWDADAPNSKRATNVSINQEAAGAEAGRLVANLSPKGKLAILTGTPGALNLEQRVAGFRSVVDTYPEIDVIATDRCNDDVQRAVEIVEQRINATPDLASYFFVGMWPFFADLKTMPQLKAFVERDGTCVSLDALEGALNAVEQGYCNALVGYSWWGFGQTASTCWSAPSSTARPLRTRCTPRSSSSMKATSGSISACKKRQAAASKRSCAGGRTLSPIAGTFSRPRSKMAQFTQIQRGGHLPDMIVEEIMLQIDQGRLKPGETLPTETALAASFGVSRNVVREAIARLRSDGVLQTRQGRGARVLAPSERATFRIDLDKLRAGDQVASLFELRGLLEIDAAGIAATRRKDEQLKGMEAAIRGMEGHRGFDTARLDADAAFHRAVGAATQNAYLASIMDYLSGRLKETIRATDAVYVGSDLIAVIIDEHKAILDAIRAANASAARQAMRRHILGAGQRRGVAL